MKVLKLNEVSPIVKDIMGAKYSLEKACDNPDAIILRSFDMHSYDLPKSTLCVGRAGAGVNNIPYEKYAESGVVVFNTPGANANAVKELVICAMLLSGRKINDGINWTKSLKGKGAEVGKLVESGKKDFIGGELMGKKLGVVGLGAIGALVANAAVDLGMTVYGFDPYISIMGAWNLNNHVKKCDDIKTIFKECDFITLHVPLLDSTKKMINKDSIATMKKGVNIINCSRGELVDNGAIIEAVQSGKVNRYVTDFPTEELLDIENIITIPHLGASTPEAEDNCAIMVAKQMVDFIENGNITNSVNFPSCQMSRCGIQRLTVVHNNVKNVISAISDTIGKEGVNISGFVSQSENKKFAYAIIDVDEILNEKIIAKIAGLENIVKVRVI